MRHIQKPSCPKITRHPADQSCWLAVCLAQRSERSCHPAQVRSRPQGRAIVTATAENLHQVWWCVELTYVSTLDALVFLQGNQLWCQLLHLYWRVFWYTTAPPCQGCTSRECSCLDWPTAAATSQSLRLCSKQRILCKHSGAVRWDVLKACAAES